MADKSVKSHDYHIIDPSPWPFLASFSVLAAALGFLHWLHGGVVWFLLLGLSAILYVMLSWWRDVIKEGLEGHHTRVVELHLRYGMLLFIASEAMLFVSFFWAYFNVAFFPDDPLQPVRADELGGVWPPKSIHTFDPWDLPFINTLILLLSGTTVTWAHHALLKRDNWGLQCGLALSVALGCLFTFLQAYEYHHAAFGLTDTVYGAVFFMATGFHGLHVIIGTIFLAVCFFRARAGHFSPAHHFGFEAAAWYWHFVDVVWLFLFASIYVWGAGG